MDSGLGEFVSAEVYLLGVCIRFIWITPTNGNYFMDQVRVQSFMSAAALQQY